MDRLFALLLSCFFLSGFSALLYQTAWTRELSFVFGTADLAVAAVLAAYMGGLALGAAVAARLAGRVRRPVLVYGVLELAIACCAVLVPWAIRGLSGLYVGLFGGEEVLNSGIPAAATAYQLAAGFAVLLPPTALMGATLPLLARHAVRREEEIAPRVGLLYAVNTTGAIAGTLCAAFWLMPELGLRRTVWVGAALNALVFALAALLARSAPLSPELSGSRLRARAAPGASWVLPAIALSGAVSFAYEVLWTRLLGHLLGASLQAFATMLASFLLGIALGSAIAARLAGDRARATLGFAVAQLGIAVTSYAAFSFADRLPDLSRYFGAGPEAPFASTAVAVTALLPVTLCIGATFPFAVRILTRRPEEAALVTARIYSWNTVGAIAGALGGGFLLLPALGFDGLMTVGVVASLGLAMVAAAVPPRRNALLATLVAAGVALALAPPEPPWRLISARTFVGDERDAGRIFAAVGRSSTVVVTDGGGRFHLATNGLPEASIDQKGTPLNAHLGHWLGVLPAWLRPDARELLVVGLGGGVALELIPASYESVDVIELEPEVLEANRFVAADRARDPLSDPRVRVHIGDARGTLSLLGDKRFDAIVSQPSHPWTAGASHLYTREFFSLVKSRLEPDGLFLQWIGGRFVDEALMKALLAALVENFAEMELFVPSVGGFLFAASDFPIEPLKTSRPFLSLERELLARFDVHSYEDLLSLWTLDTAGVRAIAEGSVPNSDDGNQLASRSAGLGDAFLNPAAAAEFMGPYDPLRDQPEVNRAEVVRALMAARLEARAQQLAGMLDGAEKETALGWIELENLRQGRAARHFRKALETEPARGDTLAGLILATRVALAAETEVRGLAEAELAPEYAALIEGWRRSRVDAWQEVAELDAELARIAPSDALFEEATRLRVRQRLEAGEVAEAVELAALLLSRRWDTGDAFLHARANLRARDYDAALMSLTAVADRASTRGIAHTRRGRAMAERALEIGRALPEEQYAKLRQQLRWANPGMN